MKKVILLTAILLFTATFVWAAVSDINHTTQKVNRMNLPKIVKPANHPQISPQGMRINNANKAEGLHRAGNKPTVSERTSRDGYAVAWQDDFEPTGDYYYYQGANYIWNCPDEFPSFATRFTSFHNGTLDGVYVYFYDGGNFTATQATFSVYNDDGTGHPGTLVGSTVQPISANFIYIDLSSIGFSPTAMTDFYVGFAVTTGNAQFISDDGSGSADRSYLYDTAWSSTTDYYGSDYEWVIDAIVTFTDTWTTGTGDWQYLEDSPTARDTVSHSPTHCWWIDEGPGYYNDALESSVFHLTPGYDQYQFSMYVNIEFPRSQATPGSIDEVYYAYIADVDATPNDWWHIDSFNAYDGNSWWCGTDSLAGWPGGWGYGNDWNQWLQTPDITLGSGTISLNFMQRSDSEPGYDYCFVKVSTDNWGSSTTLASYDGAHNAWYATTIDLSAYAGQTISVRFLFASDSGYSDEDGSYMSEGGWFIDDVEITDGTTTYFEDDADTNQNFTVNTGNYDWVRLFYDYDRDYPAPSNGWELVDNNFIFNGTTNITSYADKNIRFKITAQTDDSTYAHGAGLYIDDITITGISLPEHDMSADFLIVPYPTSVGIDPNRSHLLTPKLLVHEAGWGSDAGTGFAQVESSGHSFDYRATNPTTVNMDEYSYFDLDQFMIPYTVTSGTWNYAGWIDATGDSVATNDTTNISIQVYPENQYELGYNSREWDGKYFTSTKCGTYFTPFTDGIFTARDTAYVITGVKTMLINYGTDNATDTEIIEIYDAIDDVTPGTLLYSESFSYTGGAYGTYEWANFTLSQEVPVNDDFFIIISGDWWTNPGSENYDPLFDNMIREHMGQGAYTNNTVYWDGAAYAHSSGDRFINALIDRKDYLSAPTNLVITMSGTDAVLSWDAVSGATGYNIYRSTDPYSFGTVYDTSATNSYTDTAAGVDTKYFYKVTATD